MRKAFDLKKMNDIILCTKQGADELKEIGPGNIHKLSYPDHLRIS
jgi:hypothetical protein